MRFPFFPAAALALLTLSLLTARPALAQVADTKSEPIATLRAGVYLPFNSHVKDVVGKTWAGGGIDYAFQQKPGQSRTLLSVDYIERSRGPYNIRIIPVTIGQFTLQGNGDLTHKAMHPYFGIGVGVYFVHQNILDTVGNLENRNTSTLGGYLAAGLDFPNNLLLEARYHIIPKVGTANSTGLHLMAGIRF